MPEVIFNGSDGRLEGRYVHGEGPTPPLAMILHPHPLHGGTMNNRIVYSLFHMFARRGFSVLRFNFRGVGRSQGVFDHGQGELRDAAAALDWMQQPQPQQQRLLGRGLLVRRLDRHAAPDAPARDRGLHVREPAGQHVRLHLPRPLPRLGPDRARRARTR